MNTIKKILGIVWMLLAPVVGEAAAATKANVTLQWTIILIIFIPICAGLFIFGRYSYKGYYNQLPQNSEEITDY
jgi:hypothetical protein